MSGLRQFTDNDDTKIKGATDDTLIGNTGDALKVSNEPSDFTELMCVMRGILNQLQIITVHLQNISDLDLLDGDEEDYL